MKLNNNNIELIYLKKNIYISIKKLTCISDTVHVNVASRPTSTVIFLISSTNLGFIPSPRY